MTTPASLPGANRAKEACAESVESKASVDYRASAAFKVCKVCPANKVRVEKKATPANVAHRVSEACKAYRVSLVRKVRKATRVFRARPVKMAHKACPVPKVTPAHKVFKACPVKMGQKVQTVKARMKSQYRTVLSETRPHGWNR